MWGPWGQRRPHRPSLRLVEGTSHDRRENRSFLGPGSSLDSTSIGVGDRAWVLIEAADFLQRLPALLMRSTFLVNALAEDNRVETGKRGKIEGDVRFHWRLVGGCAN